MKLFKIYQINLTKEERNEVNSMENPHANHPKYKAYTQAMSEEWAQVDSTMYTMVAQIVAKDLNDVFQIGNIGPKSHITQYHPMHSLSVGDVIMDEVGRRYGVAGYGFVELELVGTKFIVKNKEVA